ncbi:MULTISPECIES: hypothetical protein [Pseudomonas]|uniref:Uncharacterized protein n=1 Tax=Pseudomonas saxonica TaxID=2600598 RepID=A0A5C5PUK6_9PSED|nr:MULTISPECIES: hypothetical protein [Pseudomonas]MCH4872383.1 hypothetical protein [Pseudomonas sp. TMW22091]TWR86613.1 hypothetical protein FJD37_18180 [Pseudomonas saxonica]
MSIEKIVFGLLGGILVIGAIIWIVIALRIAYTHLNLMLKHLENSSTVTTLTQLKQGSLWGRVLLVGSISSVLTFPDFYIKRGRASAEDISLFPTLLKRKLVVLQWGGIVIMSSSVLLFLTRKVFDWLR